MGTIVVARLGKAYKTYPSHWSRLREWLVPGSMAHHSLKWVLKDISFTVSPGEAIGIIGINGAGKSTLLKLVTGTTQPTTGSVQMSGRVAALLELGMGFHPEFTGRQNVYMAGQLLGVNSEEITSLMPEIEDFAEIGAYIDMPVRVYSSGMQMRLAFSVATAIRPDILIVDEALSVGDAYFQHKSFNRIREFRKLGTTLLIVSHDKQAIQSICDRAILLSGGLVAMEGEPEAVMDFYNAMLADHDNLSVRQDVIEGGKLQTASGSGEASIVEVRLLDSEGRVSETIAVGQAVFMEMVVMIHQAIPELVIGFMIKDRLGQPVFGTNSCYLHQALSKVADGETIRFRFSFDANLGVGSYSVAVALHAGESHVASNYHWLDLALVFSVMNTDKPVFIGSNWIPVQLTYEYE